MPGIFPTLLLALTGITAAQGAAFEVASIKLHPEPITVSQDPTIRGSRVTATASTLLDLVTTAYAMRYDQVSGGPAWVNSTHYDIAAKAEGDAALTKEHFRRLLQALLADRFQLKVHRETKEVPVFALVVGKNGPKLKETSANAPGNNFVRGGAKGLHMEASKGTMEQLARQLSVSAGRSVVDKTGLTGYYAWVLDWIPPNGNADPDSDTPALFTAIQEQLGLKLEPTKGSLEMLVIDSAQKPSEN